MDDIIKRQLALIKQCYLHASEQARIGTSFNRVLALVCLGWCVETLLKSVIRAYNPSYSPRKDPKWDVAWEEANKALLKTKGVQLQHKLQIKKIQEARNLAQHQATIPSKETMDEALVLARSFIDQTLQDAFAISLSQVRLSLLVQNQILQRYLHQAESALERRQWLESALASRVALELGINREFARYEHNWVWHRPSPPRTIEDDENAQFILRRVYELERRTFLQVYLGLDLHELGRFYELTPTVRLHFDFDPDYGHVFLKADFATEYSNVDRLHRELDKDKCLGLVNYAVDNIVRWESQGSAMVGVADIDQATYEWLQQEIFQGA